MTTPTKSDFPRTAPAAADLSPKAELVNLAERRVASPAFAALFAEGIALIDEAADYLDGIGRGEAAALPRAARSRYAAESRALSTRLMNLTSWLLLQRAVSEGDMSMAAALEEGARIDLGAESGPEAADAHPLPPALEALIGRAFDLQRQVRQLDASLRLHAGGASGSGNAGLARPANTVAGQLGRLRSAFERP